MRLSNRKTILILILALWPVFSIYAGPPDNSSSKKIAIYQHHLDSIKVIQEKSDESMDSVIANITRRIDSLKSQYANKSFLEESLLNKLDSLKKLNYLRRGNIPDIPDIPDYSDIPSYQEIIIDENGVIKVLTDSGLTVIHPDSIPNIPQYYDDEFKKTSSEPITQWGKSIIVDEGERILSDIVLISGDATINGSVEGDVLVIGGNIYVNSSGYIRGDATAIGGHVKKEEGAKITGNTVSITSPMLIVPRGSWIQVTQLILFIIMIAGVFLSALSMSLFPKPINRITDQLLAHPLKSFLFGYGVYIGAFLLWLLLLVSIIGIPLALIGQPLAMIMIAVLAYSASNVLLGEKIFKRQTPIKSFFYGILITTVPPFILITIGYISNSIVLFAINILLLMFFIFVFLPFGLGAAFLARFGFPKHPKANSAEPVITNE